MENNFKLYSKVLVPLFAFLLSAENLNAQTESTSAPRSSLNIGLGFNYNSGGNGYYGANPMFGYGGAGYSMGAIGNCFPGPVGGGGYIGGGITGGGWNNGGFANGGWQHGGMNNGGMFGPPFAMPRPAMPPLPPPRPFVPPHIAMGNSSWGGQWGYNRGPMIPGPGYGINCVPCIAGVQPMPIGPVAGGPVVGGGVGYEYGRGGIGMGGGFDNRMEWEKSDTGDLAWATAIGLGMQTTNVYPVAFPRNDYPYSPNWFNTGARDSSLIDRETNGAGH